MVWARSPSKPCWPRFMAVFEIFVLFFLRLMPFCVEEGAEVFDEEFFVVGCTLAGCFVFAAELVCTGFFGVAVADASWVDASLLAMANPCMERQSRPQMPTRCQ